MPRRVALLAALISSIALAQGGGSASDFTPPPAPSLDEPGPAARQKPASGPVPAAPASSATAAPAAPGAPATPPSGPAAGPPQTADEAFNTRVKTLEEQVGDLKEKIFRTKARLLLLQETVLGGELSAGARAVLFHRNEMGSAFVLESVAYALDGAPIFTKVDQNGDLDKREELEIFNGRIVPGQHQLTVKMVYRGHGFGVFSYLEGFKVKPSNSYTFNVEAGKVTTVKVRGYDKGGLTARFEDKVGIAIDTEVTSDSALKQATEKAATPSPSEAAPKGQ